MAKSRMFSIRECRSDTFLNLDPQTREFYLQLCLDADDDGCVDNAVMVSRMLGYDTTQKQSMLSNLENNNLIIIFKAENVLVIRHWRVHNAIAPTKHNDTRYINLVYQLEMDSSQVYQLKKSIDKVDAGYKPVPIYQDHQLKTIGIGGELIEYKEFDAEVVEATGDTGADADDIQENDATNTDDSQTLTKTEKNKLYKQFKKIYPSGKRKTDNYDEVELQREFFARIKTRADYETLEGYIEAMKNSADWLEDDGNYITDPVSLIISPDWQRPPSQT